MHLFNCHSYNYMWFMYGTVSFLLFLRQSVLFILHYIYNIIYKWLFCHCGGNSAIVYKFPRNTKCNKSLIYNVTIDLPASITIETVGSVIQGTSSSLIGTSTFNSHVVNTPIQFTGRWTRQDDSTEFEEVTSVSDSVTQQNIYYNIYYSLLWEVTQQMEDSIYSLFLWTLRIHISYQSLLTKLYLLTWKSILNSILQHKHRKHCVDKMMDSFYLLVLLY